MGDRHGRIRTRGVPSGWQSIVDTEETPLRTGGRADGPEARGRRQNDTPPLSNVAGTVTRQNSVYRTNASDGDPEGVPPTGTEGTVQTLMSGVPVRRTTPDRDDESEEWGPRAGKFHHISVRPRCPVGLCKRGSTAVQPGCQWFPRRYPAERSRRISEGVNALDQGFS